MEEHNYVDCQNCAHWDDSYKRSHICENCKNLRSVIDPKEILCNRCAGPMRPLGTHNEQYPHGIEDHTISGGYDSYHLFDMTSYTLSLCEKCLRELFNQFKIAPRVIYFHASQSYTEEEAWKEDQKSYEYRVWKDAGHHHQSYLDKKCNAIKDCPNQARYTMLVSGNFTEDCACEEHKELRNNCLNCKMVKFIPDVLKPFL